MEHEVPSSEAGEGSRDVVRTTVARLLASEGPALASDPRRVEAFLRDLCGEHPAEISVAVSALREGVAEDLRSSASLGSQTVPLLLPRLAARLREHLGIDEPLARWAVGTWALALGAADEALVKRLDSQPGPESLGDPSGLQGWQAGSSSSTGATVEATEPVGQEATAAADVNADAATVGVSTTGAGLRVSPTHEWPGVAGVAGSDQPSRGVGSGARRAGAAAGSPRRASMFGAGALVLVVVVVAAVVAGVVITRNSSSGRKAGSSARGASARQEGSPGGGSSAGGFHVPPMGTYRYSTIITGASSNGSPSSSQSSTSTAEMLPVGSEVGVAWTGFGGSLVQSDLYKYSRTNVVETSLELLNSSGAAVATACIWSPPLVVYEAPFAPGHSWSADSSCSFTASGAAVSDRIMEQVHVVKRENVSVPGGTFNAVLVDMIEVTTTSTGGTSHTDRTSMAMLVDPSTDTLIREVAFDESTGTTMTARLAGFVPMRSSTSGGSGSG